MSAGAGQNRAALEGDGHVRARGPVLEPGQTSASYAAPWGAVGRHGGRSKSPERGSRGQGQVIA